MHMIARVCLTVGASTLGGTLVWVIHRLQDLELEVSHMKRVAIVEHEFLRRQIREVKVALKAHCNEITIRELVSDSIEFDGPKES